jgi:hypothetical protein
VFVELANTCYPLVPDRENLLAKFVWVALADIIEGYRPYFLLRRKFSWGFAYSEDVI